jgi:O-antigen/teichoic acid export membrane protein
VLSQIGIGTLAVYSRLLALIRQTENIVAKFSLPLTPTASSLQGSGRDDEVRLLVINSTRYAAYLSWPILLGLAFVGDDVLQVWMGPKYDPAMVLTLMALGTLFPLSQQPQATILVGLNLHGRYAALNVIASVAAFACSLVALRAFHWDLLGLAGLGLAVSNVAALWIAIDTCWRLSIPVGQYFRRAYTGPIISTAPFAIGLVIVNYLFQGRPWMTLGASCALGVVVLVPLYWRHVLSDEARAAVIKRICEKAGALRLAIQPEWR